MKENKMINSLEFIRNMLGVRAFVYMPTGMKEFVYNKVLRKKNS